MEKNQKPSRNVKDAKALLSNLSSAFNAELLYAKIVQIKSTLKANLPITKET